MPIRQSMLVQISLYIIVLSSCSGSQSERTNQPDIGHTLECTEVNTLVSTISIVEPSETTEPAIPPSATTRSIETTISPSSTPLPNPCPKIQSGNDNFFSEGSIIYSYSGANALTGIWSIFSGRRTPELVVDTYEPVSYAVFSKDFSMLAWIDTIRDSRRMTVLDFATGMTYEAALDPAWIISDWTDDHLVRLEIDQEIQASVGKAINYALVNPISGEVHTEEIFVELPDFSFSENNYYSGYASLSTTREFVLYTARRDGVNSIVLRDLRTGENLWEKDEVLWPIPLPNWTIDSTRVAFSYVTASDTFEYMELYVLDLDGNVESLTEAPILKPSNYFIEDIRWSPNQGYIYIQLTGSNTSVPGFIINVQKHEVVELCDDKGFNYLGGKWLPGTDYFIYFVESPVEDYEVRLLDIDSWSYQAVLQESIMKSIIVHGWTYLEIPENIK